MKENRIAIIGGGASGIIAALKAAQGNSQVILFEKNHILGRKILSTGSGKCNLSNQNISPAKYNLNAQAFLKKVFSKVKPREILDLLGDAGLWLKTETDGRIFPRCMNAQEVVDALSHELQKTNIQIYTLTEITEIIKKKHGFSIKTQTVKTKWDNDSFKPKVKTFDCEKLILACGSKSYPRIGGGDAGYKLAHSLDLKISNLSCAIVPLVIEGVWPAGLSGTRCDVLLSAFSNNKEIGKSSGEILFTDYGISGPVVLDISRDIVQALQKAPLKMLTKTEAISKLCPSDISKREFLTGQGKVECLINFFPELSVKELEIFLKERLKKMAALKTKKAPLEMRSKNKDINNKSGSSDISRQKFLTGQAGYFLKGVFGDKISKTILNRAGIKKDLSLSEAKPDFVKKLIESITTFSLEISSAKSFEYAMATSGGVELSQINPETFEVKGHKGLYITGELLDIDGNTGGYNLHFAWTSGFLAGVSAGKKTAQQ